MHVHMMLSCRHHNVSNRDSCVAIRGSFELLHSVVYIETKHGGICVHCVHAHISLGSPNPCDASAGQ